MTQRPNQPEPVFDVDAAINECLDLEAAGRPDDLRDLLARARAEDSSFDAKLLQTRAAVGPLRRPPLAPDVSRDVLTEVDYLRPFLSPRRRRQVSSTRVAVAAAAVITLSFMGIMQRMGPRNPPPAPVDAASMASGGNAGESVRSIASAVDDLRTPAIKPPPVGRPHRWEGPWSGPAPTTLSLGNTSQYDRESNWSLGLTLTPGAGGPIVDYHASEERLKLAQTGWPETPEAQSPTTLSLSTGGLIERARSSSVVSRLQQEHTLDLGSDSPLSVPWSGRTELERLFGPFDAAKADTKHK